VPNSPPPPLRLEHPITFSVGKGDPSSFAELSTAGLASRKGDPSPPSASPLYTATENPISPPLPEFTRSSQDFTPEDMAFPNIDPTPMMLPGFSRVLVNGREKYNRVVSARVRPANEDLAIVMVSNLPPGLFPFAQLRAIILDLLVNEYGLVVKDIQKSPFARGQAYVRLNRASDRDSLIHLNPHNHNGFSFDFVCHTRGSNARRVVFNRECWLMLIGYPRTTFS